jgi:hypothetical protein
MMLASTPIVYNRAKDGDIQDSEHALGIPQRLK